MQLLTEGTCALSAWAEAASVVTARRDKGPVTLGPNILEVGVARRVLAIMAAWFGSGTGLQLQLRKERLFPEAALCSQQAVNAKPYEKGIAVMGTNSDTEKSDSPRGRPQHSLLLWMNDVKVTLVQDRIIEDRRLSTSIVILKRRGINLHTSPI